MKLRKNETDSRKTMQLLFLIAAGIVIFPLLAADSLFPGYGSYLKERYMVVPCLMFFGSALCQRLSPLAKKSLLLSITMVLWFLVTQTHHWLTGMSTRNFGSFAVVYLLAFPYAAVTEDGRKSTGLNWIGRFYMAYSLLLVFLAGMLLLDAVPKVLAACVRWEGTRLSIFSHPNGNGCILLLGIGFSLYFITGVDKKWKKYVLSVLAALQFLTLCLTNSRTSILVACALIGGTLFFALWNGSWKRFLTGAAAALAVIVVLFSLSGLVYDLHTEAQITKLLNQSEAEAAESNPGQKLHIDEKTGEISVSGSMVSSQGELSEDMKTLNGRIWIWKAAFESVRDNPPIKSWGTEYVSEEISYRTNYYVVNAHNSWIQTLMQLGIMGFLLAIMYTLLAVWNIWMLLWRKHEDMGRKIVAIIVICLLLVSILESYLFVGGTNFANFLFFLCTGYLVQWNTEASAKQ